ncbi:MAG: hypothetical protein ACRD52_07245 [Candidatus Acidiferrales bacterium]
MAIIIKQDGSQQPVVPANHVTFSQEEIAMFGSLGWVLMGSATELSRENRTAKMESERQ